MIVAGFGFRAAATRDSLADALARASGGRHVDRLATAADKVPHLAAAFDLPVVAVAADLIAAQDTATSSPASRAARGTGSLAEAAALAAAGRGARLIAPRAVSCDRMATCALAEGEGT